jgi:hypothetical protein
LPDEEAYHLQIHKAPNQTFLKERISRRNPVPDFEMVVSDKLGRFCLPAQRRKGKNERVSRTHAPGDPQEE